jgi:HAMP domain-containing protein
LNVHCILTPSDYRALRRHVALRYQRLPWFYAAALMVVLAMSWFSGPPDETTAHKVQSLFGATVLFILLVALLSLIGRLTGSRSRATLGDHAFEISADGITEINPHGRVETHLNGIRSVDETDRYFFILTKAGRGHVIPKAALSTADELRALQTAVRTQKA